MTPKDIVIFIEGSEGRDERLAFAAALATLWKAHLIVTFVPPRITLNRHASFAVGSALTSVLEQHQKDVRQAYDDAKKSFDHLVRRGDFTGEWRAASDEVGEELMLHARHASLAVLGPPARATDADTTLSLSEDVIFASGRPSLMVPIDWPAHRIPQRIVIGWNAGREATRAIAGAMPLLVAAQDVRVVVVPDAKVEGLHGVDPGADISHHLARHGVPVELEQHEGTDAGAVLLDRCQALDADLLVMGAVGRSKISEFVFGGATRTVLGAAGLPIFLAG
jgi:nucleotide-binding universal stress UspA family protein